MEINILFEETNNRSVATHEGAEIGESTFSPSEKFWIIDHTYVDEAYGGQGVAKRLVEEIIEQARKEEKKLTATCPYALKLFQTGDYDDIVL